MQRPILETTEPSVAWPYNATREYNGAKAYANDLSTGDASYCSLYDVMDSQNTGKLQLMHPCSHYRRQVSLAKAWITGEMSWYSISNHARPNPGVWIYTPWPLSTAWGDGSSSKYGANANPSLTFGAWQFPVKDLPSLASQSAVGGTWTMLPELSVSDWNLLKQRALNALLPQIKSNLSLPNALYELKDMRTLRRSNVRIHQGLDALKRLKGIGNAVFKAREGRKTLRTLLRSVSDSYLQTSFNLAPLLRDIAALRGGLGSLYREIEDLLDRANTPQKRHYRCRLTGPYLSEDRTFVGTVNPSLYLLESTLTASRSVRYSVCEFTATIDYSYSLPSMSDDRMAVSALLDKLGVNLNPSIIWNAIPWSFVVDWVFGVSRWLDQYKVRMLEPTIRISGFCCAAHVRRHVETQLRRGQYAGPVSTVVEEVYERKVGLDQAEVTSSIQSSGLNLKEVSLSAALAFSR